MSALSVVIPYYQREPGHLVRAIRSVLCQREVGSPSIIVVDDGSPLPASVELAALSTADRRAVAVLRQPNRGPGAARNAGLDLVPAATEWIAFLDSDDAWQERHLARGLKALEQGYDFFFSDLRRDGDPDTHFGLTGFDPSSHRPLPAAPLLFAYVGDFFTANLNASPVGTSTVIIRKAVLGAVRFPPIRETQGEDLMFWLEAARVTTRVVFDGTVQVRYGRGNMTNSESWKSAKALRNAIAYGAYISNLTGRFRLDDAQAALVGRMRRDNRQAVARIVLAMLRERRHPEAALLGPYLRRHPGLAFEMVRVLGQKAVGRLLRARTGAGASPAGKPG